MKSFNTSGPIEPETHYHLPPLPRAGADGLLRRVGNREHFTLYGPPRTGKTSALIALRDALEASGYGAVYVSLEGAQASDENVEQTIGTILDRLAIAAPHTLGEEIPFRDREELLDECGPYTAFCEVLERWAEASPQSLVLLLDEVDGLHDETLETILLQLRVGSENRPPMFPRSVVLCGSRHAWNYPVRDIGSLNFMTEPVLLGDFSDDEVRELLDQHTTETGQPFAPDAIEMIWQATNGQPWLVNCLAYGACFDDPTGRDRRREIAAEAIVSARERWIDRWSSDIEPIVERSCGERMRLSLEPLLAGSNRWPPFHTDDLLALRDAGLVKRTPPVRVANPIYGEVMTRALTREAS